MPKMFDDSELWMDDMMFVCDVSHLVLFFKHFERMRLLVGHIYALQAVDVPGKEDRDKDDGKDDVDIVLHIDLSSPIHLHVSYFGRQDLVICVSPASMASTWQLHFKDDQDDNHNKPGW